VATKSEESLRAFVEEPEPEPEPAAQPAAGPASPGLLPALIPPPPGSTGAKNKAASGKAPKASAAPKKAAGGPTAGANAGKTAQAATTTLQQNLSDVGNRLVDRISSWDTPGGVGLLLLALFILLWMIVPVNGGHTRFGLLWLTLTGQTYLPDDTIPTASSGSTNPGGCPPGYLPDGKGGCMKAVVTPFSAPGPANNPSGWPDLGAGAGSFGGVGTFWGV
jgi:hypothetical protein